MNSFISHALLYRCANKYLRVAGSCAHEDLVIGLSAGLGSLLIVILVSAVLLQSCRTSNPKDSNKFVFNF